MTLTSVLELPFGLKSASDWDFPTLDLILKEAFQDLGSLTHLYTLKVGVSEANQYGRIDSRV